MRRTSSPNRLKFSIFKSTHPKRGETCPSRRFSGLASDLNPLTPSGVRLNGWRLSLSSAGFKSTHPKRGETYNVAEHDLASIFKSTHPKRGETVIGRGMYSFEII